MKSTCLKRWSANRNRYAIRQNKASHLKRAYNNHLAVQTRSIETYASTSLSSPSYSKGCGRYDDCNSANYLKHIHPPFVRSSMSAISIIVFLYGLRSAEGQKRHREKANFVDQ